MSASNANSRPRQAAGFTGESRSWLALPAMLMAAQAAVLISVGQPAGSWADDQTTYHLVAIHKFATELPKPDIVGYKSATSPGWHLLLALLVNAGASTTLLRIASACVGTLLALVATTTAGRWVAPRTAAFLTLPLVLTPYAVGGSAWITTDVPAMACVALALASLMRGFGGTPGIAPFGRPESESRWRPWVTALWTTLGVAVRQPVIWLVAIIAIRGWRDRRPAAFVAMLVPIALLVALVATWQGLIPPAYRYLHERGANPAGLIVFLALIGAWGAPLALALALTDDSRKRLFMPAFVGAVAAAAIALSFPSSYAKGEGGIEGRWGGPIWSAVQLVPAPGERSILLVALAAAGGATLTVMVQQARRRGTTREAGVVVLALACVAATNAANSQAWERYADLPLLLLLPWLAATGVRSARAGRALCGAAVVVAIAQVSIAFVTLWKPALGFIFGPAIGTTP